MPRQIFNNQVRPTYTSPEQKEQMEKMNMLNMRPEEGVVDSGAMTWNGHEWVNEANAYQQFPIQSQNGAFTEGTQFQIKPPEDGYIKKEPLDQSNYVTIPGSGANPVPAGGAGGMPIGTGAPVGGDGLNPSWIGPTLGGGTGGGVASTGAGLGGATTGGTTTGTGRGAIGGSNVGWDAGDDDTGTGTGTTGGNQINEVDVSGILGTGAGSGTSTGTGIGMTDTTGGTDGTGGTTGGVGLPQVGTGLGRITGGGSIGLPVGGDGLNPSWTGPILGGGSGTGESDPYTGGGGTTIAPTGGTGTGTGDGTWTDYSQTAGTSRSQNPFSASLYGNMQNPIQYLRGQGIDIGEDYSRYFQAYEPEREQAAYQQYGLGQESAMMGARGGLMGITQQQGAGGFSGVGFGGSSARGIRSQFGLGQQQAGLGVRGDVYGMRKDYTENLWNRLSDVERNRGEAFGRMGAAGVGSTGTIGGGSGTGGTGGGGGGTGTVGDSGNINPITQPGGAEGQGTGEAAIGAPSNASSGQLWTNNNGVDMKWSDTFSRWMPSDQWDYYDSSNWPDWYG